MIRSVYRPLNLVPVSRQDCFIPKTFSHSSVTMDSPALHVMTDLTKIPAATITTSATLTEANQAMIRRGVRMLFVSDTGQHLLGVVTSTDLIGEKPMLVAQQRGMARGELLVEYLMTPVEKMEAISMSEASHSEVGQIVATLKEAGRQHVIAVELDAQGRQVLRGIFSASQLSRQLGVNIDTTEIAHTFAEVNAAIGHA